MSKEDLKEDIISDINRLLSKDGKDGENINELFNSNAGEKPVMQQQKISSQFNQMPSPQQIQQMEQQQMQQQLEQQMYQQQMEQQHMQQQMSPQMQQQLQQQAMQQQAMQQQAMQQHAMQQQAMQQHAMQQQAMQQQMQHLSPQQQQMLMQKMYNNQNPGLLKEHLINQNNSFDINNIIYNQRDSLVLFLLYVILLTPQVNGLMNKIPYTSDVDNYPGYLGILLRGVIFITIYISMKNLNLL
jgi:hypothetical protein